jgi:hypothetical protein
MGDSYFICRATALSARSRHSERAERVRNLPVNLAATHRASRSGRTRRFLHSAHSVRSGRNDGAEPALYYCVILCFRATRVARHAELVEASPHLRTVCPPPPAGSLSTPAVPAPPPAGKSVHPRRSGTPASGEVCPPPPFRHPRQREVHPPPPFRHPRQRGTHTDCRGRTAGGRPFAAAGN